MEQVEARMRAEQEGELKAAMSAEKPRSAPVPSSCLPKSRMHGNRSVSPLPSCHEAKGEDANADLGRSTKRTSVVAASDDVLNAAELVREDKGVQPGAEEPDWELIEKLEEIAERTTLNSRCARSPRFGCRCRPVQLEVPLPDAPSSSGDSAEWSLRMARNCGLLLPRKKNDVGIPMRRRDEAKRSWQRHATNDGAGPGTRPAAMKRRLALEHLLEDVAHATVFLEFKRPCLSPLSCSRRGPAPVSSTSSTHSKTRASDLTLRLN